MTNKTQIETEAKAIKLSRAMDRHAVENTDEWGNWKTKKAERAYAAMDRRLQKLDAELDD